MKSKYVSQIAMGGKPHYAWSFDDRSLVFGLDSHEGFFANFMVEYKCNALNADRVSPGGQTHRLTRRDAEVLRDALDYVLERY